MFVKNKRWAIVTVVLAIVIPYGLLMTRFSLRNDQIEYFLPVRMYMRDAFLHHEFMLWNPFMSGSYPIHCDMQGAVWNPVTILLTFLFKYNTGWLSVEFLLYYVIGAVGAFYFARQFSRNYYTCIVIAVVYGCGGFATSIMEFMSWVGSFAWLPWVACFFYRLLKRRDLSSCIGLAISSWLMLVSGYPSFLIYLGYCLLAAALVYCWQLHVQKKDREMGELLLLGLLSLLIFVLLALPAIQSFYEYLPYYGRGKSTSDAHINSEFFSWNYPVSLLFPVAGTLVWDNDLYIGLVPLLVLVAGWSEWGRPEWRRELWRRYRNWLLAPGFLFTLLFTLGRSTPVRRWSARHLPLLDSFGFSHSVGVFLMLAAFIWLAPGLDAIFEGGKRDGMRLRRVQYAAWAAAVLLAVYAVVHFRGETFKSGTIRWFYILSAGWQLALLVVLGFSTRLLTSPRRLLFFVLADLAGAVLTVAPVTGLTVTAPWVYDRSVTAFYRSDVREYLQDTTGRIERIRQRDPRSAVNALKIVGRNNFPSHTQSDTFFNYISDERRYKRLLSSPFVFAADSTHLDVREVELGYNHIGMVVNAEKGCQLVIRQTFYGRWRAEQAEYQLVAYEGVFLSVPLRKGVNRVRLCYYSGDLKVEAIISLMTLLAIGGILGRRYWRGRGE